ncbi:MAG: ATP-binding protein [Clostridium sp.]|nr:ATP-binding protein [Clostridium sp.]
MILHIVINIVQLIGILVPFAGCVVLLKRAKSNASMYLLLANLGCLIINGSYLLLLLSTTQEGAHIAMKMEYFGTTIFYLMFAMFLWTYMRLKPKKWAVSLLSCWAVLDVIFLFLTWTGDIFGLVFQELDFIWDERTGLVWIHVVPGIVYFLHYCIICVIGGCGVVYTFVRMCLVQIKTERNNLARLLLAQCVITAALAVMLYFNPSFDIVPICNSLAILAIIVSIHRNEFFGITDLGRQWAFEQMEDAFIVVDGMYGYLDSNAYARKVFPDLKRMHKNQIVPGDVCRLFMEEGKIQQIQGKYYNKKKMEIWENGKLTGYSMMLMDITEQYELMERVKQEKERADEANRAKSAFVSNVSHEIRTPMNAIVGMTQIMLRRELPAQDREYLMNIQNSGNALLTIVNDLLDMSKIESGKMELVDEEYSFMSMLSDLGMIILNRIGAKPVELLFDIDPAVPAKLYGDALRIRQVIINIMNNATKFTEEGYVCLTVSVKQIKEDDIELYISVKDTGQGIREEDLTKLFGSFQQVDTKKNHHKEGTGLGLSISKQLVELMNGSIGVTSEYGKGSEFYFTIHQKIVDEKSAARISPEKENAAVAGSMRSQAAKEMLKKLTDAYRLSYIEDVLAYEPVETSVKLFYFTDCYDTVSAEEKRKLEELDAVVCGMLNPMTENNMPEDMLTMNKPLYSANFCNLIENGQHMEEQIAAGESVSAVTANETPEEGGADDMNFTAPEASILIVDDNEINCMVAEEMLRPLQMQMEAASDGQQALMMVQKKHYDLIFMDHLMPVMNGVEATQAIRRLEGAYYKNVPIIALTGNTAKEQRDEYKKAGMNGYLSKPLDMADIYKIVRKWIPDKVREN